MAKTKTKKIKDKRDIPTTLEVIDTAYEILEVIDTTDKAILLANKFILKAYAYKKKLYQDPIMYYTSGCKESGALKKASMDLARILPKVRNPDKQ